jgi:hypothetical protein
MSTTSSNTRKEEREEKEAEKEPDDDINIVILTECPHSVGSKDDRDFASWVFLADKQKQ